MVPLASAVLALPQDAKTSGGSLHPRIMGGSNAKHSDYPFVVYLYNEAERTFCGGSIVSDEWILTAAHCIKAATTDKILVYVGQAEYNLDTSKGSKVAEIHSHPAYNDQSMVNDISLLRLEKPISKSANAASIDIDSTSVGDGVKVTALGWGYTEPNGSTASKQLQKGDLTTLSVQQCGSIDTKFNGNNGPRICVAADKGPDTCPGDSGGPLIRKVGGKNVLVGITSFGTAGPGQAVTANCGGQGMISIFTHANYFQQFIDSSTGGLRHIEGSSNDNNDGEPSASNNDSSISDSDESESATEKLSFEIGDLFNDNNDNDGSNTTGSDGNNGAPIARVPVYLTAVAAAAATWLAGV
ncbi:hypothetical protein GGF46_000286 [Coemansia sp. RSA 552]|nr:hypothetical protein GGF46_000286 [Coemansia sp. RSA 552]